MEKAAVTHYETREYMYPLNRRTLLVKVKLVSDAAHSISIIYWNKFNPAEMECKLESYCIHGSSEFYTAKLTFDEPAKYIGYYFLIRGQDNVLYYSPYGLTTTVPTKCFEYSCANVDDIFTVPEWAKGAVGYQIFPERFFNGDPGNDPPTIERWNALPSRNNFFGGDLRGLIQQIHHIKQLGIEILYLTPIFHSPSNHKYDTIDYFAIDPTFGELQDLQELVGLCHSHHIKIMLDGVFNHIGYYSEQFQDAMRRGKQSPYWDWFYVDGDQIDAEAVNYECVGYYKWMPKLKFSNTDVREYFMRVGEYWIKEAGIDGWRLDVADEVDL